MSDAKAYQPPKVWVWNSENGGEWAKINRPISGATHEKALPTGEQPLQLYSLATPNGQKVTIMLEELLEAGERDAEYDAFLIKIGEGDQFSSGFVDLNPNSKIPVLYDTAADQKVFETSAILLYLAEKFGKFLPTSLSERTQTLNWLFWTHGAIPFVGGGFGHFYHYAPTKIEYAIDRYTMETKRQLHLLDQRLGQNRYVAGDDYTIADIAAWPWYGSLVRGALYEAAEFLDVTAYTNIQRWAEEIWNRPAVQRGRKVNRTWGEAWEQLPERHAASDFDTLPQK